MKDTKEAFVEKMDTKMEEWKKEIDEMEAKAEAKEAEAEAQKAGAEAQKADAELKEHLYEKVHGLRKTLEDTKNKLQQLRKSGDASWEKFKKEIESAGDDLRRGIDSAIRRFK